MKHSALTMRFVLPVVALAALLLVIPAEAQLTTASISGTIVDDTGPIPGASVAAVNASSGFRRETTAGNDGSYQLSGLHPGVYEISVSSPAYKEQSRTVQVLVGQNVAADFRLTVDALFTENITVVGEATQLLVDVKTSEVTTNITQQQIENLPLNNRNFLAFAGLAPGVSFTTDTTAAGQTFRSGGQNPKQVNVFIDGVSFKNDVIQGGAFMQDSSRGNPFPQSAVQEYQVLTQNYKAEYEKASAAVITAVTKSGGNQFTGDVFYFYQDEGMVSRDFFAEQRGDARAPYERNQYGFSLGGPVVQDRMHFFLTAERNERDVVATVTHGAAWDKRPANVAAILDSYPTGTLSAPLDSKLYFGKFTWQPTYTQSVDVSYHRRDENEVKGFGGQRVQEGASSFEVYTDALTGRHQYIFGGNAINEAVLTWQQMQWKDTAIDPSQPHLNYVNLLDIGGKDFLQNIKQQKIALRDDVSLYRQWHGSHTIKGGGVVSFVDYRLSKASYENPYFEFRENENWQYPFQARYGFGDPSLDFDNTQYGLYLQDDWSLNNFSFSAGVRWDYEDNMLNNDWVTPPDVAAGLRTACRTYGQPVGGQTDWCINQLFNVEDYISDGSNRSSYKGMIQPRLGLTWDPMGDAKTVLFAGWGIYYDRVTLNDIYDEQYRHSYKQYSFCFTDDGTQPEGCGVPAIQWNPSYQSAAGLAGLIASGQTPGPEIFLLRNDTKPPKSTQWTAGVRRQLTRTWLGSLTYANSRGRNGLAWSFGTLPPGTALNDRWGNWISIPGYGFIMRSFDERRTEYDGVFLTLDRPRTAGSRWGANIAYSYGKGYQNASLDDGTAFAFDYIPTEWPMFAANGDERHKLIMSGSVGLPAGFEASSIISLGSGTPYTYTNCLAGWDQCQTFFNGLRPEPKSFLGIDEFAYQSVDLRLQWTAPAIGGAQISLIGEAFNVLDTNNFGCLDGWAGAPGEPNARFGQPNCAFNSRRFQFGTRIAF
ncbi:MAG TPA: TonB-dependent receptor [Thermoanaerobaculia bacterium]